MGLLALVAVVVVGSSGSGAPGPTLSPPWVKPVAKPSEIRALERLVDATPDSHPESAERRLRLARLYVRSADTRSLDAGIDVLLSLAGEPSLAAVRDDLLFALGSALFRRGSPQKAREAYMELIRDHPRSPRVPSAYAAFGDHFFARGDLPVARQFYDKAMQFPGAPAFAYALYKSGWVAIRLGEHQKALESFFKLHRQARGDKAIASAARDALIVAYAPIGRPGKAFAFFRRVDASAADRMQRQLARVYVDRGNDPEAIASYRELIARNPRDRQLCLWQAEIARAARRSLGRQQAARELAALRSIGRRQCQRLADEIDRAP